MSLVARNFLYWRRLTPRVWISLSISSQIAYLLRLGLTKFFNRCIVDDGRRACIDGLVSKISSCSWISFVILSSQSSILATSVIENASLSVCSSLSKLLFWCFFSPANRFTHELFVTWWLVSISPLISLFLSMIGSCSSSLFFLTSLQTNGRRSLDINLFFRSTNLFAIMLRIWLSYVNCAAAGYHSPELLQYGESCVRRVPFYRSQTTLCLLACFDYIDPGTEMLDGLLKKIRECWAMDAEVFLPANEMSVEVSIFRKLLRKKNVTKETQFIVSMSHAIDIIWE